MEKKRDVKLNMNMKTLIMAFCISILTTGCGLLRSSDLNPTYNSGGYILKKAKNDANIMQDSAVILGIVKNVSTGEPIKNCVIKLGCYNVLSDENGVYQFKIKPGNDLLYITSVFIGFKTVETKPIKLVNGESLKIDFFWRKMIDRLLIVKD
jgi:hypothetical protein